MRIFFLSANWQFDSGSKGYLLHLKLKVSQCKANYARVVGTEREQAGGSL